MKNEISEKQEDLRNRFEYETDELLYSEHFTQDEGFSDAYVEWLEKQLIKN